MIETLGETCDEDGGFTASREKCKEVCASTEYCTGFEYVHDSDKQSGNDKCYLTDGTDSERTDCPGSESWEMSDSCVLTTTTTTTTTTTVHDCWQFESRSRHSTLTSYQDDQSNTYDSDSAWMACEHYEHEDTSVCSDDGKSWNTDRDSCKQKCEDTMGCQSFSYADDEEKCWLSKIRADEVDEEEEDGYEMWTTECTTTTFCELCEVECPFAEILDLRYVAWSNLGGLGPNQTVAGANGESHNVPPTIVYYNVFNASDADNVVYLIVSNLTEYRGNAKLNGVSREAEVDYQARIAEDPSSYPAPMEGAYGSVNLDPGSDVTLKFQFMDSKMEPMIPKKIVAMTFLDIDQPQDAEGRKDQPDDTAGVEQVSICTGPNSFGWPDTTQLNHSFEWVDEDHTDVCHDFASRSLGFPEDNPWNPSNVRADGGQGLEEHQMEKIFTAAYWQKSSFEAKFKVRADVDSTRNFLFAGHATSFCGGEQACYVKMDSCAHAVDSEGTESERLSLKQSCLERSRCEERESEGEYAEKQEAIQDSLDEQTAPPSKKAPIQKAR